MKILRQRQAVVAFLMAPTNEEVTASLHDCVKHVKNIPVRREGGRGEGEREGGREEGGREGGRREEGGREGGRE